MTRIACSLLLLFPLLAQAQDDPAVARQSTRVVSVEVTIFEISGHLEVADPEKIDVEKLEKAVRDARQAGVFRHLTRVRFSTLDQQQAMVQLGQMQPVPTGRAQASRGPSGPRVLTSYSQQETGTLVSGTPRIIEGDQVLLEMKIEQSRLLPAPVPETDDDPAPFTPPSTTTLSLNTTVKVPSGQTVLVSGAQTIDDKPDQVQTYVMLRATASD